MLNAFIVWLVENWNIIVDIFMWGFSLLMAIILVAKIYKIVKFDFEMVDAVGLFFVTIWILAIIFIGFDHIRIYLQGFL